jgi:flagellar biosynthesis GTPase FlhF
MKTNKQLFTVNKMNSSSLQIKNKALALILGLAMGFPSFALTDYKALGKELEIMDSVMTTALKQVSAKEAISVRELQTKYLAGQGVVYSISTSNRSRQTHFGESIFVSAPPSPPFTSVSGTTSHFYKDVEIEEAIEHAFSRDSQQLRETRSSTRNLAWQLRDAERRAQDLAFEMQNADKARKSEIESQVKQLKKQNEELKARKRELQERADKIEKEQKQKREAQKAAVKKANQEFLAAFEESVSDNLCRFGAGLRALPKTEHITFVLNNFSRNAANKNIDRIYVFTALDVTKCVQEKMSVKELLAKATVYDF